MKRLLGFFSVLLLAASLGYAGSHNQYPSISEDELQAAIASKSVVLLDANGTASYNEGHIPGALNYEAVKGNLASVLPSNKYELVVAYCGGEKCTAYQAAADDAVKLGYMNVRHFAPGISGWKSSGAKVEKSS